MATGLITKRAVDAFAAGERQSVLWDAKLKGFGLLALPSGGKSYVFQYRIGGRAGRMRRYTIGRHGSPWTPEGARKRAEELAAQVRQGVDPFEVQRARLAAEKRAATDAAEQERLARELVFSAYAKRWLVEGLKADARPVTRSGYESTLRNHVTPIIGDKALPDITKADVRRVIDGIPADQPAVRRLAFAVMRPLFGWAKARDDIAASPMDGMAAPAPVASRDRVLTDEELALALRAARQLERPFGAFYELLFATGQRRDEVAGLDWSELDRAEFEWTLPGSRAKNGKANLVPLNRRAMAVLDQLAGVEGDEQLKWPRRGLVLTTTGKTPLSGFSRGKARLDAAMLTIARKDAKEAGEDPDEMALAPWRLHDARRTLATGLQRLGVRFEVTEAVLNHTAGASRTGVAAVYQRHGWGPEKRAALEAWCDFCERLLNSAKDGNNVVPLRVA